MKSLAKILKPVKFLAPVFLGAWLLSTPLKAQEISFLRELKIGVNYNKEKMRVENIPLIVRDVPKHPEDDYALDKNVAPIQDERIALEHEVVSVLDGRLGGSLYLFKNKFCINTGVCADLEFKKRWKNSIRSRNYTNAPGTKERGYGAALTYYSAHKAFFINWNTFIRPRAFCEIGFKFPDKREIDVGYEVMLEKIVGENGWDRWNSLETYEKHSLANLLMGRPYLSIKGGDFEEDIRLEYIFGFTYLLNKQKKDIAKDMNIYFNPGLFIGLNVIFN